MNKATAQDLPLNQDLPLKGSMDFAYGVARELLPGVTRLVANNPGPFTFKGTNSYLIGRQDLALIDPGPADDAHLDAILAAAAGRPISHIFVTHTHRDHTDALAPLLERLRPLYETRTYGFGRGAANMGAKGVSPSGRAFIDETFVPDVTLKHGAQVCGADWALRAIYTPGHAPDHLCFALEDCAAADSGVVFSGDHVMAWNTTVVAPPEGNMADYMASLELLLQRSGDRLLLPGHGGQIDHPRRMLRAYLVHRQWREQAILRAIRDGHDTIRKIVAIVYRGLDQQLINAAALSVLAHVEHLANAGLVTFDGAASFDGMLCAV